MEMIYVITWRYSDGSSSGVVRAYSQIEDAQEDMEFLNKHGDPGRCFAIVETEFHK